MVKLNGQVIGIPTPVISVTSLGRSIGLQFYHLGKEQIVSESSAIIAFCPGERGSSKVRMRTGANMYTVSTYSGSIGTTTGEFMDSLGPL